MTYLHFVVVFKLKKKTSCHLWLQGIFGSRFESVSSEDTPGQEKDFGWGGGVLINKKSIMGRILEWRQAKRDQVKDDA